MVFGPAGTVGLSSLGVPAQPLVAEIIVGGIFAIIGLVLLFAAVYALYSAATIWRSEPIPIREVAQDTGVDEFEGIARPGNQGPFREPFSGEEAVLSTYTVRRREKDNDGDTKYRTVESGTIERPFHVEDETGRVELDPTAADIYPDNESQRESANAMLPEEIRLRLSGWTEEIDLGDALAQSNSRRRRYNSGYIAPGDEVHVYGTELSERMPSDPSVDARVASAPDERLFTITAGCESEAIGAKIKQAMIATVIGLIFVVVGVVAILA